MLINGLNPVKWRTAALTNVLAPVQKERSRVWQIGVDCVTCHNFTDWTYGSYVMDTTRSLWARAKMTCGSVRIFQTTDHLDESEWTVALSLHYELSGQFHFCSYWSTGTPVFFQKDIHGHILRRNCLLKQVIERKIKGEMEVARRRGRRRKKVLDDLKDRRGYSHLKEEACIALHGGTVLEEALDLSSDRILNEWIHDVFLAVC